MARLPRRHARTRIGISIVVLGLVAAACGGGGKKTTSNTVEETTTSTSIEGTTTTLSAADAATSTTAAPGAVTTTTARRVNGTASTVKKTAVTAGKNTSPTTKENLLNVQATTTTAPTGKTPNPGGQITVGLSADTVGFDPAKGSSNSSATEGPRNVAIFDTLFFQDSATYELVAQLALGMTSTDAKVWELKLRPNVKFSDGTVLDANAVKFNFERIKDPALASPVRSAALLMTDLTAVDATTLRITLASANGQFPRILGSQIPWIGSPTAIQKQGSDDFNVHPVGAGPYLLKEYVRGDKTVLERNPGYYAAPLPYLDRITIRVIPDDSQRLNSIFVGELQMARVSRPQDCAEAKSKGRGCIVAVLNGGNDLILNHSKAPFNNKTFRQALSEAIDLDAYNAAIEGGAGIPVKTMFQQGSAFYENIQINKFDPADAAAKFKQVFDANGGKKTEFTISASLGKSLAAAEFMQGQLLQDGSGACKACTFKQYVTVNVTQVTTPILVSNSVNGTYDAQVWANLPLDPEPNLYTSFRTGSSSNFNRYSNTQVDAALDTGRTALDINTRKAAYRTFQQIWADEQPSFMYARVQQGYTMDAKIQDVRLFEDGTALFDRIWLDK